MKYAWTIGLILIFAVSVHAQITGSSHDFSAESWSGGKICIVCHTPHNANENILQAPLWNHAVSNATYTLYDSPTMDTQVPQPFGRSKLCLSCHDGTVAVDQFGDNAGGTAFVTGDANLTTDLSNDHPVSLTWSHQTVGKISGNGCNKCHVNIGEDPEKYPLPFYTYDGGTTYKLECSSCHDPHNGSGINKMLRMSNANSAICTTCH